MTSATEESEMASLQIQRTHSHEDDTLASLTLCSSSLMDDKAARIEAVLAQPTVDLWELRELALSPGGLVNDSIRQRAWPALVGLHSAAAAEDDPSAPIAGSSLGVRKSSTAEFQQVELDVARCTWHLLTGTQRVQRLQMEHKRNKRIAKVIKKKQRRLASCIERTLEAADQNLHYYQGYHDVACIFLATLRDAQPPSAWMLSGNHVPNNLPSAVLLQVSRSHLMDCMRETFLPLQTTLSLTIFPMLALLDPEVHDHLDSVDMAPFFALPWVLTWFAHEIRDTFLVKRIFDAFCASHPALPLYVCLAMLLHPYNRMQILETESDFSALHQTLTGLPKNSSCVGWKYQPGTGYVSDHEQDDATTATAEREEDDDSIRTDTSNSVQTNTPDGELVLLQAGVFERNLQTNKFVLSKDCPVVDTISISSTLSTAQVTNPDEDDDEDDTKVPFQSLLDTAVQYMHRIPPRRLLGLAKKYHGPDRVEELLLPLEGRLPVLLQEPMSRALAPTAPAEWWLKAKAREARGLPPRVSRTPHQKQHRRQHSLRQRSAPSSPFRSKENLPVSPLRTRTPDNDSTCDEPKKTEDEFKPVSPSKFVQILRQRPQESPGRRATVASGMALSIQEEKRQRQRERILYAILTFIVTIILVAIALTSAIGNGGNSKEEQSAPAADKDEACPVPGINAEGESSCPALTEENNE